MATHVCILGIDGSGKSTVVNALPDLVSGFTGIRAATAGESFRVVDPDQTILDTGFSPAGLPVSARLARWLKRAAKRYVNHRLLYPAFKILQLAFQDAAAKSLDRRYGPEVVVSDGNLILSAAGRAVNYFRPARSSEASWDLAAGKLRSLFAQLSGSSAARGWVRVLVWAVGALKRVGFHTCWLPDVVILLDLEPEGALGRIRSRGGRIDAHENGIDLSRARAMYLRTIDAVGAVRGRSAVLRIPVGDLTAGETIQHTLDSLKGTFDGSRASGVRETLGRTKNGGAAWMQFLSPGYLFRCLAIRFFWGTWREPMFPLSKHGRRFMNEGYSASVMQDIYDQDVRPPSLMDRPYMGYPLHRAVYDRLHLLVPRITKELARREGPVRIFTAPSGKAEDVFRSIDRAAAIRSSGSEGIHVTALDLDPNGRVGRHLRDRSAEMETDLNFIQGDLTAPDGSYENQEKYHIMIFVGLSSWLSRPQLLEHLRRLRDIVRDDGVLVTDVFTPGAYALSGWHGGYRACYYRPDIFASLLEVSGFNGNSISVSSGRDGLNHVMVCSPSVPEQEAPIIEDELDWLRVPRPAADTMRRSELLASYLSHGSMVSGQPSRVY